MKKTSAFDGLVGNAFDFLRKALEEFENEPKFSVIHFYAAIELFLKARLMHEHWTLILSKPEQADLAKFQKGDFHSVSLSDAQKRLTSALQDGLTQAEYQCFSELADHRNRMVHFFHAGQHADKSEIVAIVGQQCRAWFFLHSVLTERWSAVFAKYQDKIASHNKAMKEQRSYLKAKFEALGPEISDRKKAGATFHECPSCGYGALQEDSSEAPLLSFNCLVCDLQRYGIAIECPSCSTPQTLIGEPWQTCSHCGHKITDEEVKDFATDDIVITKDDPDEHFEANCAECDGYHTVVRLKNGWWLCTQCFTPFEDNEISVCGWCNEPNTGDMEDSSWSGCGFCEGRAGWDKDD